MSNNMAVRTSFGCRDLVRKSTGQSEVAIEWGCSEV